MEHELSLRQGQGREGELTVNLQILAINNFRSKTASTVGAKVIRK
jgi:hypothetical protein